ncbi:hypothetical protein HETIRDRAFT_328020 [Heterobasidion irregulare TC 32-1]|uniref:Signal peptidase complex subunit 1 n=1 Tax=Heterobasidion irregulare (strain TC 32-1) TaxID=747525 RepID=W4JVD2_HETIT|nr:uncharacterized protein HETIRDRAFT_328020 [Heterobasidion irregulare TC 32-1]ETW76811.1 hypothetical protein HETIRDRAFT_328020 [Heterobasidion irregulare TC 32-1]
MLSLSFRCLQDFEGQRAVERISRNGLLALTAVSYVLGLALQSLRVTFGVFGLGIAVLLLVAVPQWPAYNKHPVRWLPKVEAKKTR